MKKYAPLLGYWLINSLLLLLAFKILPAHYVLGTYKLGVYQAALFAGIIWTVLLWVMEPLSVKFSSVLDSLKKVMAFYFLLNFVALWLTARIAPYSGFGTTSYLWLLLLSFVAVLFQTFWRMKAFKS